MANVISRESIQEFRLELIQHIQEGLPVETELATVERALLAEVVRATSRGELAVHLGDQPTPRPCTTCTGSGWEHITRRIRSRYVDCAVRCTTCEGRGAVAA